MLSANTHGGQFHLSKPHQPGGSTALEHGCVQDKVLRTQGAARLCRSWGNGRNGMRDGVRISMTLEEERIGRNLKSFLKLGQGHLLHP